MIEIGDIINKSYEIIDVIYTGQASNINVYEVKKIIDNKIYAMKVFNVNNMDDKERLVLNEIFAREEKALRAIESPFVVGFYDSGTMDDYFYIVMEFLHNSETLLEFVKKNKDFSGRKKISMAIEITEGLIACHEMNIVHRDLKPQNIMFNLDNDMIKIIDFGISKVKSIFLEKQSVTLKDYMTINYASPEQISRGEYTEKSDIYSLGCLFIFLFSGEEPPTDKSNLGFEIGSLNTNKEIKSMIYQMTQNDIEKRPLSCDKVLETLLRVKENLEHEIFELNIIVTKAITRDLYNLSKIDGLSDALTTKFVSESIRKCNLYKGSSNKIYLIGDRVSYDVKINSSKEEFVLVGVKNIPIDKIDYEQKKGIKIKAKINIHINDKDFSYRTETEYLNYMLEEIEKELKKVNEIKKQKNNLNSQLKIWNNYLNYKKDIAFKKGELGVYTGIDFDESGNFLHIITKSKLNFEEADKIQITTKNGKKEVIGDFYDYYEEKIIIVRPISNFDMERYNQRGVIGVNTYLDSIVTNRYSNAIKELVVKSSVNKNLLNLLNEPHKISLSENIEIKQTVNKKFLESTKKIVEKALSTNDIFLIQGPPGTGKTTIITEIVSQIYLMNRNSKILFVSPSHVAVDHAINNIQKVLEDCIPKNASVEQMILRMGMEEKISIKNEELMLENHTNRWVKNVKEKSLVYVTENELNQKINSETKREEVYNILSDDLVTDRNLLENLLENENLNLAKLTYILKDWYRSLYFKEEFNLHAVEDVFLVASTCTGIASGNVNELMFDWVIIDEAARATAPELLIPLVKGKKAILVGDHKQLPPVINSESDEYIENKEKLEESLFENLYNKMTSDVKCTLTTQFRMHPAISEMINELYYVEEEIESFTTSNEYLLERYFKPVTWVDTGMLEKSNEYKQSTSYLNYTESNVIVTELIRLNGIAEKLDRKYTVGIISGYGAQTELITSNIKEQREELKNLEIDVNNVDAFQGSEKDIIFYSIVRSNKKRTIGFLKDERRLNVALSRAKEQLFIVGNTEVAQYGNRDKNPFSRLLNYINRNPENCQIN